MSEHVKMYAKVTAIGVQNMSEVFVGLAMAQAISCQPLTPEAQVRAHVSHVGFVVDEVALGQVSFRSSVFPVNIIPLWLSILIYCLGDEQ
jgi:hypothetical protein